SKERATATCVPCGQVVGRSGRPARTLLTTALQRSSGQRHEASGPRPAAMPSMPPGAGCGIGVPCSISLALPATLSAEGAQLNGRPSPASATAEGAQLNVPPSLRVLCYGGRPLSSINARDASVWHPWARNYTLTRRLRDSHVPSASR